MLHGFSLNSVLFPARRRGRALSRRGAGACLVAGMLLVALAGCAGTAPPLAGRTDTEGIELLRARFADGNYYDTVLGAKEFLNVHAGSRWRDEAMFILARAEYEEGEFIDAEDQFRRLLRDFPSSQFAEESAYSLALALLSQSRGPELDQTETEAALAQFRSFLRNYPDSAFRERAEGHIADIRSRFAAKEYKNGITYTKIGAWSSAAFYFEKRVIAGYPDTEWARRAAARLIECRLKLHDWQAAADQATRVIADFPGTEEAAKATSLLDEARRHLAESAGTDSTRAADGAPR